MYELPYKAASLCITYFGNVLTCEFSSSSAEQVDGVRKAAPVLTLVCLASGLFPLGFCLPKCRTEASAVIFARRMQRHVFYGSQLFWTPGVCVECRRSRPLQLTAVNFKKFSGDMLMKRPGLLPCVFQASGSCAFRCLVFPAFRCLTSLPSSAGSIPAHCSQGVIDALKSLFTWHLQCCVQVLLTPLY